MAENEIKRQRNEHLADTSGPAKDGDAAPDKKQQQGGQQQGGQQQGGADNGGATQH